MTFSRRAATGALAAVLSLGCLPAAAIMEIHDLPSAPLAQDFRDGHLLPSAEQLALAQDLKARANWNRFGTVHSLMRHDGPLATGYSGAPVDGARAFIRDHRALFRLSEAGVAALELVNEGVTPGNPGRAVLFRQRFGGLPSAHDGLVTVGIARGNVYYVSSSSAGDQPLPGPAVLGPTQAWLLAAANVQRNVSPASVGVSVDLTAKRGWHLFNVAGFAQVQRARLVAMPIPAGGVRQAWETIVLDVNGAYSSAWVLFVDAQTGEILRRENRVNYQTGGTTNTPYSGALPADGSCAARHDFVVGPGIGSIAASASTFNLANDIYVDLYFVGPGGAALVAHGDTGTSPESATYTPAGGVPEGTYQVAVCSYDGVPPLPPYDYSGVFTTSEATTPQPVPFPPTWSWFGSTPDLVYDGTDVRMLGCWIETEDCGYPLENLAARAPWDVNVNSGEPTYTTTGNYARTAASWGSPLTPSDPQAPTASDRMYIFPFENIWNDSKCDTAEITPGGIDVFAATTNLFVAHNRMHDWSYFLGFTERNYNLQLENFGLTASDRENDPEIGNAQAGALSGGYPSFQGRDNANQITLQDGVPGVTNQYLWQPIGGALYAPCADGDFDMIIAGHEYTHAISNRMVGGPDTSISSFQGDSMGEAWSDLAAIEYQLEYDLVRPGYEPTAVAAYVLGNPNKGLRNYALNANPLNYSNFGFDTPGPEYHADAEIWAAIMWQIRQALVAKYDSQFPESDKQRQKDCADGKYFAEACPGNRRWMQNIFDSFLLMPAGPSMLDARDAMLAADMMRFDGANQFEMWHALAAGGMGENAWSVDGETTAPIPNFESPLEEEAVLTLDARAADENGVALDKVRLFIGQHTTRSRHVADTDPATVVDETSAETRQATIINGNVFRIAPGTYDFIVVAPGYGQHRFTQNLVAGTNAMTVHVPTNRASVTKGATVTTSATQAENTDLNDTLIDDSEDTGTRIGDEGLVVGAHATVKLAGGPISVRRVHVSAAAGPNNPGRITAIRSFEIRTCNGTCADPIADFGNIAYTSAPDFFPGDPPRTLQPDLNLRMVEFPPVTATHIQLRVLHSQCTGNTKFHGQQDNDLANNTDCPTVIPGPAANTSDPLSSNPTPTPPGTIVRMTDLQAFGSALTVTVEQKGVLEDVTSISVGNNQLGGSLPLLSLLVLMLGVAARRRQG